VLSAVGLVCRNREVGISTSCGRHTLAAWHILPPWAETSIAKEKTSPYPCMQKKTRYGSRNGKSVLTVCIIIILMLRAYHTPAHTLCDLVRDTMRISSFVAPDVQNRIMKCKLQCYIAHRVGPEKEHQAAAVTQALGTCKKIRVYACQHRYHMNLSLLLNRQKRDKKTWKKLIQQTASQLHKCKLAKQKNTVFSSS
jgi:hypothetical protein